MTDENQIPKDERPEDDLADTIETRESPYQPGHRAAVAVKDNVDVCWNCFDPLLMGFTDIVMGHALVRVCKERICVRAVMNENSKRKTERMIERP